MAQPKHVKIAGDIAHDDANVATSAPVKIGGIAKESDGTDPGSVAEDDRVDARFNRQGGMFVDIGHPYLWSTATTYSAAQTGFTLAGGVAAVSKFVTDIVVGADTSGTFSVFAATTTALINRFHIPANGGSVGVSLRNPYRITAGVSLGGIIVTTSMTNSSILICGYHAP